MPDGRVLLEHVRLIDGRGGEPVEDAALVVDGERLAWVGPATEVPADHQDVRRIDLGGRTVCPGFIDAHVHFALPGPHGNPLEGLMEPPSYRVLKVLQRLRTTLDPLSDLAELANPDHVLAVVKDGRLAIDRADVLSSALPLLCP